jgi:hypothetical protein
LPVNSVFVGTYSPFHFALSDWRLYRRQPRALSLRQQHRKRTSLTPAKTKEHGGACSFSNV